MKKLILYLAGALVLAGCGGGTVRPSKNRITKKYSIDAFKRIECNAAVNLVFLQEERTSAEVQGPDNIVPNLIVSCRDSTLRISVKEGFKFKNLKGSDNTTLTVTSPELNGIRLKGAGNITLKDSVKVDNIEIGSFGAGNFKAEALTANNLDVRSEGVGNLTLKGKTRSAVYYIDGIGNLNAKGMMAADVVAEQNGIGNISCYASETITARTQGIGNLDYYGNPEVKEISKNGLGNINAK